MGEFAPKFAELNDNVLFGEVWSRTDKLGLRDRQSPLDLLFEALREEEPNHIAVRQYSILRRLPARRL